MLVPINKINTTVRDALFAYMTRRHKERRLYASSVIVDLRHKMS